MTDVNHCGDCDKVCSGPPASGAAVCEGGQCSIKCDGALEECDGKCVDTQTDAENCGKCGAACAGSCKSGLFCVVGQKACDGKCVDVKSDGMNCGVCGKACQAGEVCLDGGCAKDCGALTACSGSCVDLKTNSAHCGDCSKSCTAPPANGSAKCTNSQCGITCAAGYAECTTGVCTNTKTDSANCGGCDKPCGGSCQNGLCCANGQNNCGGVCKNLQTDALNCLTCGNICAAGQVCSGGDCTLTGGTDKTHNVNSGHCLSNEVLKGVDWVSASRIVCEPSNEWDPNNSAEVTVLPVNGIASCPAKHVAVGWVQATKALICRPFRRALTDTAPLAADTNDIAALGMPSHQNDYYMWFNGTFNDELPMCKTRNDAHGAMIELSRKTIKNEQNMDVSYVFSTCGL
jgi:hypothetical protein